MNAIVEAFKKRKYN